MNKRQRVLLIGGKGFLGTSLQKTLKKTGKFTVTATGQSELNILDFDKLQRCVQKNDIVINLTGQITSPIDDCIRQNTQGITQLCFACKQSGAFLVQLSSVLVYGTAKTVTELSTPHPESYYAKSKMTAEYLVQLHLPKHHLIIRLSNLYGETQQKGLFWYLIQSYKKGKLIISDNDGTLFRNFIHGEDAATIITALLLKHCKGIYNVASPEYYSIRDLVALIEKITGKKFPALFASQPAKENIKHISTKKLSEVIDLHFTHGVQQFFTQQLAS